ncbi:MAG: hypothetical protein AB2777_20495 [Candidatus Thiodiazotropha endolucinida]
MSRASLDQLPDGSNAEAIADYFWHLVGSTESFPRQLERSIAMALPVTIVSLPSLTVSQIEDWLRERQVRCPINVTDRRLRACIVAQGGHGVIFVDGADAEDERRFSVAHDAGHFLADYWLPRTAALLRLGDSIQPVLDGFRPPTVEERINGLVTGLSLPTFSNLMGRDEDGLADTRHTILREDIADQVALELLAPRCDFERLCSNSRIDRDAPDAVEQTTKLAVAAFGLPARIATRLAERHRMRTQSLRSVRQILGM